MTARIPSQEPLETVFEKMGREAAAGMRRLLDEARAEGRRTGLEEAIAACDAFRSDGQTHAVALILARQISILLSAPGQTDAKCTCNGSGWVKVGSYESACPATVHAPKPDESDSESEGLYPYRQPVMPLNLPEGLNVPPGFSPHSRDPLTGGVAHDAAGVPKQPEAECTCKIHMSPRLCPVHTPSAGRPWSAQCTCIKVWEIGRPPCPVHVPKPDDRTPKQ